MCDFVQSWQIHKEAFEIAEELYNENPQICDTLINYSIASRKYRQSQKALNIINIAKQLDPANDDIDFQMGLIVHLLKNTRICFHPERFGKRSFLIAKTCFRKLLFATLI
jgi:hypothetical protein